jgi:enoyl-CoA hydratase/carnithine racemase
MGREPTTVVVERAGGVLLVTLDRPHRLNAIDATMRAELAELWAAVRDDRDLGCVVLTGRGRAFSSGADTAALTAAVRPAADLATGLAFLPGRTLDVPVVLALNGLCVGGGLQFVADADIIIAAEDAWLCATHVTMGQVSGAEALTLAVKSRSRMIEPLALGGLPYRLTARDAHRHGIVAEVVPAAELRERALARAADIAAQPADAVRATVRALRAAAGRA